MKILKVQRPKSKVQGQILTFVVLLWTLDFGLWTTPCFSQLPTNNLTPSASAVMADTNGVLTTPANFFAANSNAVKTAAGDPVGSGAALTNLQPQNFTNSASLIPTGATYDGDGTYFLTVNSNASYYFVPGPNASPDLGVFWEPGYTQDATTPFVFTPGTNVILFFDDLNPGVPVSAGLYLVTNLYVGDLAGIFTGAVTTNATVPASTLTGTVVASQLSGAPAGNFVVTNTGSAAMLLLNVPPSAQSTAGVDYMTVVASPTPFSSGCGGWFFPIFSTNHVMHGITGDEWSTLPNGTHVYLIDAKAGQINGVGEQYNTGNDINSGCWGIFENPTWNYYEGSSCLKSTITGQYADWFFEDFYTNATLHWPGINPPGATNGDPRLAPGGLGSWDAMTLNEFTRVLTGFYLTAGGTNIASTNQFQVNTPKGTNSFAVGTNGIAYASVAVSAPTVIIANAPTFTATNAAPGDVTVTSGVISTAPAIWITITNNGIAYSIPAYK